MATNVTEKDKTLQEIIDWCEQLEIDGLRLANALLMQRDTTAYGVVKGQIDAYGKTADHCRSMLGYSGSMLSCLTYEDTDNSDPSDQPQVGDYGVAVRETADGQEEIPFHIEREERTGLPVALLNERLYAKPEDDIKDGLYVSLFQLYLDRLYVESDGPKAEQRRGGIVMWFKRRRNEFGCPMCGRLPKIVKSHTQDGDYIKSIYRLQCPRKHLSTNWYSDPMDASIQWKHVVDEYKRKDTK